MPAPVRLTVPSDERALGLIRAVAQEFGTAHGLHPDTAAVLDSVVHELANWVLVRAYPGDADGELQVALELRDGAVVVQLRDRGEPVPAFGGPFGPPPDVLEGSATACDELRLENLGGEGKRLTATLPLPGIVEDPPRPAAPITGATRTAAGPQDLAVRTAQPGDAETISRLLYANYGLSYGHPAFYRPRWVAAAIAAGRILSTVALDGEEVVGHHALLLDEETAGETGVAVVSPDHRGMGIFRMLQDRTLSRARERGLDAVYARAVTTHPYSQRAERRQGYREAALLLGAMPASVQARAIEPGDAAGLRAAHLVSYLPLRDPGPRAVTLPARYDGPLGQAYERLGLTVAPARAHTAAPTTRVDVAVDEQRGTAVLAVRAWAPDGPGVLRAAVRETGRRHEDVLYADLDLHALRPDDLDAALEVLHDRDFFLAGLLPFGPDGHDRLRLQRIQAQTVAVAGIVTDSQDARALHDAVMADRALVEV